MLPREPGDPRYVGRFLIVARIGVGGMAIVYFGRSTTGRAAAIKVMHREFARRPDYRARFQREIAFTRAAGGRYSPGVLDAGPDAEIPWLAIEFLPSVSLRDAVRAHGPFPSAWGLATGIAEALGAVHAAGILHLDLKPANVLLTADGPRLIDFGIAAEPGTAAPAGSPGYMSPEQQTGGSLGPASDVYSFGATMAFAAGDTADEKLRALITRCLQSDPAARPTVPDLRALPSSPGWLPPSVDEEIRRRAAEAVNPPVPVEQRRPVSRRGLLIGLGALLTAAAAGTAAALWPRDQVHQQPTPTRPPAPPRKTTTTTTAPTTSKLEIYAFGATTVKSLTVVINGQSETVTDPALPWTRVITIPAFPTHTSYSVTYTFTTGNFTWKGLVDGYEYASGTASTTDAEYTNTDTGTI
ncbi:MAG TPA: serine/threonine-protein kinase [Pseudonocardiaceae bacterium]|jgi:hypothetical protein|nr:serine/threonine-protein kinase [Pseudonocardiaceae bacterium]